MMNSVYIRRNGNESDNEHDNDIEKQTPFLTSTDPTKSLRFRPLEPKDREQIQKLHEEWFPVSYKDEFYDDLVIHRMVNSGEELITYAAVVVDPDDETDSPQDHTATTTTTHNTTAANGSSQPQQNQHHQQQQQPMSLWEQINAPSSKDSIVGCIVGSKVDVNRLSSETVDLLLSDPTRYKRMFYIMTLGTVTEYRQYGIATQLLKQITQLVQQDTECGALYLHVITFNVAAIRFYEKLGFYRVTEMKDYYRIDDKNYNCYIYAKYYHGNRGQLDYYYLLTRLVTSIWKRVTEPFLPSAPVDRTR
jgi:ribosomal protein S18 acetylase RimI-like enzyme